MYPSTTRLARRALAILLLGAAGATTYAALAAPAPWYQWRSKVEDTTVCSQFSPGDGWFAVRGPFQDGNCKKPGTAK